MKASADSTNTKEARKLANNKSQNMTVQLWYNDVHSTSKETKQKNEKLITTISSTKLH